MNRTLILLSIFFILSFSCNNNQGTNLGYKDGKLPVDTIIIERPPKILNAPRFDGPNWLYINCLNELSLDAMEEFSHIEIEASSGSVVQSKQNSKKWTVSPTSLKKYTIKCIAQTDSIQYEWVENFKVIEPPMPKIEIMINNRLYSGTTVIPNTSKIVVKIVPDADFKDFMPSDARYGIESIDVLAQLSLGPPTKVNSINGGDDEVRIRLGPKIRQARPGTNVYIRLNGIYRINHKGEKVLDKRFSEANKILSIIVR